MPRNLIVGKQLGNVTYPFPESSDQVWGDTVTDWAEAITQSTLQKGGGLFEVRSNVSFGTSYGVLAKHFTSSAVNAAATGAIRLANAEIISWRNNTNTTDLSLTVNASNQLTYEGQPMLYAGAALTASRALMANASGAIVSHATVSDTELGYLDGVTSAIQTQINTTNTTITTNAATAAAAVTTHAALTVAHGATGAVVGTTNTQTLTNKTLHSPTIYGLRTGIVARSTTGAVAYVSTLGNCYGYHLVSAPTTPITVTLPEAASCLGMSLTFIRTDATEHVITIDGETSDTINGTLNTTLNTQNETLVIVATSAGAWHIVERRCNTEWQSYAMTITGSSSNPTKGTAALDEARWRRVGDSIEVMYNYRQTVAGAAGSGTYLFALPTGITIDTAKLSVGDNGANHLVGPATVGVSTPTYSIGYVYAYSSTKLALATLTEAVAWNRVADGYFGLSQASVRYSFSAILPVAGWKS